MRYINDPMGEIDKPKPKWRNEMTLNLCNTCRHAEKDGKGYYCLKWSRSCSVPRYSVDDDYVRYENQSE